MRQAIATFSLSGSHSVIELFIKMNDQTCGESRKDVCELCWWGWDTRWLWFRMKHVREKREKFKARSILDRFSSTTIDMCVWWSFGCDEVKCLETSWSISREFHDSSWNVQFINDPIATRLFSKKKFKASTCFLVCWRAKCRFVVRWRYYKYTHSFTYRKNISEIIFKSFYSSNLSALHSLSL